MKWGSPTGLDVRSQIDIDFEKRLNDAAESIGASSIQIPTFIDGFYGLGLTRTLCNFTAFYTIIFLIVQCHTLRTSRLLESILMTSSSYIPILITCKWLHKYDRAYIYIHVTKQQERLITIRLFACSRKMSNNFINDKLTFSKLRQSRLLIENSNISGSQLQLANTTSLICFLLSRSNHSSNCLALFPLSIWHESTFGWRNDQNRSQKAIKLCS
jgi:hypothetical protein